MKEEPTYTYKLINMHSDYNITLTLEKNKIYGKSSINDYYATINIKDDLIEINQIQTTRKTADDKARKAESQYLSILQTAYSFKIRNDMLYIYTIFMDEPLIYKKFTS